MKAFLYRVCAIFFSHFVLYPDYRISFFIPLAFRFADYKGDLKKLIEDNCLHVKSVAELAQICGYSVSSFKRAFKEIFDEPIYQWILGKKADRLKERLSGEEVNLKEIIYEFGFSSPAHFTKFCKKWLGMTPTKFIEEQKMTGEHIDL